MAGPWYLDRFPLKHLTLLRQHRFHSPTSEQPTRQAPFAAMFPRYLHLLEPIIDDVRMLQAQGAMLSQSIPSTILASACLSTSCPSRAPPGPTNAFITLPLSVF